MPNKHAAIKDLRKNKKRAIANKRIKTLTSKLFKDSSKMIEAGNLAEARDTMKKFQQISDKAAMQNIFSKNYTSRKKSVLAKALKKKSEIK
ncbi:MAG: 30S ribosomal protein S20 [Patescibacteria group bacterium]